MIPTPWLETFYRKSGDSRLYPTEFSHICDEGFAGWNVTDEALIVSQCYGNGNFWNEFFSEIASKLGVPIRFATTRNPKVWERAYKARVVGYIMEVEPWAA